MLSKVCAIFTREYKKETEYREFMENMIHCFKLNTNSEDIEEKVKRLVDKNFVSVFKVSALEFRKV